MDIRLRECLESRSGNYLLPFFWVHGETEEKLRAEIQRLKDLGVGALCVESRPHPDFVGEKWWEDMAVILDEAQKLDMKVWILDDVRFPTGFAAGAAEKAPAELKKWYLFRKVIDVYGPDANASFLIDPLLSQREYLVGVVASKRACGDDEKLGPQLINVTSSVVDGILYWPVPEGHWRLVVLYETYDAPGANNKHVNHLVKESVELLIKNVYEPHYARFSRYFGNTLAGFFSDEPAFYNCEGTYEASIGRKQMLIPWKRGFQEVLGAEMGEADPVRLLPALWYEAGEETGRMRYHYMNTVSRLYGENFAGQLGNWCRDHGVEYIGHIIEDNNSHARLGNGPGHFFRSLEGQDMSGLDVVLLQILPGMLDHNRNLTGFGDGEFFHFGLAKMAVSLGHLDPSKKGRTMCEIFGAYGWMEGLKLMKWLTDHMLVRGVNTFVPHAYTNRDYPDPDCPPHFNFDSINPQYRYLEKLNHYTNRLSHLLNGGCHRADGLILYHGEAEWSGDYMLFQKPLRRLMEAQVDCDIIWGDRLSEIEVKDGSLYMGGEVFRFLVIPFGEAFPKAVLQPLRTLAQKGAILFFLQAYPSRVSDCPDEKELLNSITTHPGCILTSLDELVPQIRQRGFYHVRCVKDEPFLRIYHYIRGSSHLFMLFNEDPSKTVTTCVTFKGMAGKAVYGYDAMENRLIEAKTENEDGETLSINLSPYESRVYFFDEALPQGVNLGEDWESIKPYGSSFLKGPFKLSLSKADSPLVFKEYEVIHEPQNLAVPGKLPRFSGTMRYETAFEIQAGHSLYVLDLNELYETAEVWVNGEHCGTRLCPPYRFDITRGIRPGVNELVVDVTNTLVKEAPDLFSALARQEPSGLLGPIRVHWR